MIATTDARTRLKIRDLLDRCGWDSVKLIALASAATAVLTFIIVQAEGNVIPIADRIQAPNVHIAISITIPRHPR